MSAFVSKFCTRDASALSEATRDPIFLLLVETAQLLDYDEDVRPENMGRDDDGTLRYWLPGEVNEDGGRELGDRVPFAEIKALRNNDVPITIETHVESVWLTRQEAEAWLESHRYRFTINQRAHVYCVCANGELAQVLKDGTEYTAPAKGGAS